MSTHPAKTDTDALFFRFSSNLYSSLVARQRQTLRHEHRLGPHQMPPKNAVDMWPAHGTCCSDVSRGSCRSLPWAELARYFCQLKILLTETCLTASKHWHLPGSRSGKQTVPPPLPRSTESQNSSVCRNGSGTSLSDWSWWTSNPKFTWVSWPPWSLAGAVSGRCISLHFLLEFYPEPFIELVTPLVMISTDRKTEPLAHGTSRATVRNNLPALLLEANIPCPSYLGAGEAPPSDGWTSSSCHTSF